MRPTTVIRPLQAAAAVLLAVFLFIHAAKIFHHDSLQLKAKFSSQTTSTVKGSDCSVCDFHFMKDAEPADLQPGIEPLVQVRLTYTTRLAQPVTSIGLPSADRGPPVLA